MSAITYDELEAHLHSGLSWMHSYLRRVELAKLVIQLYGLLLILLVVVRRDTHLIEREDLTVLAADEAAILRLRCREYVELLDRVIASASQLGQWLGPALQRIFRKLASYRDRIEDQLESLELSGLPVFQDLNKEVEAQVRQRPPTARPKDWRTMIDNI